MPAKKPQPEAPQVLQFRVALQDVVPEVWRRIQVPSSYTFWDLHVAIQDAMGWDDAHLHEFRIVDPRSGQDVRIGIPDIESADEDEDEETVPGWEVDIAPYFTSAKTTAEYLYDFSDDWQHEIVLEAVLPSDGQATYPRCLDGARACPPEDCGGPVGYDELLTAILDPEHEEHASCVELAGPGFDPGLFRVEEVVFEDPEVRWEAAFGDGSESDSDTEFEARIAEPDPKALRATFREVVSKQLREGEPPETKETYERLIGEGFAKEEVWRMLSAVVASEMFEIVRTQRPHDPAQYVRWLKALPKLPFD